jgi:hypothetical protein
MTKATLRTFKRLMMKDRDLMSLLETRLREIRRSREMRWQARIRPLCGSLVTSRPEALTCLKCTGRASLRVINSAT